jgi:DMSO/TMAO reductase YedYZ molybdopterin-dependent catalytic subunit
MMRNCLACGLSLVLAFAMPALADTLQAAPTTPGPDHFALVESVQPERGLLVERAGQPSRLLSPERIAALPRNTQRVRFMTGRGEQQNEWTGPLLWDVLGASGVIDGANPREQAQLAVRVIGADGYAAVISLGEISPQFADRPILLADQLNGAPLPEHALRLIVPGDRLGGRSVREVVRIAIE